MAKKQSRSKKRTTDENEAREREHQATPADPESEFDAEQVADEDDEALELDDDLK